MPPIHHKLIFLTLYQCSFLALNLCKSIWVYDQAPKVQEPLRSRPALDPSWEIIMSCQDLSQKSQQRILESCSLSLSTSIVRGIWSLIGQTWTTCHLRAGDEVSSTYIESGTRVDSQWMSEAIRNRVNEFWAAKKQHKSTSTTFRSFSLHSLLHKLI